MEARKHPQRGYWEVYFRYADPHNPLKNKTFRKRSPVQTRRGAEKWGREMLAIYSDPTKLRTELTPTPTFRTLASNVQRVVWSVEISESSKLRYDIILRSQILPALGDKPIDTITTLILASWRATLVHAGLSIEYVNACVRVARQILGVAVGWGQLDVVPELKRLKPDPRPAWDYLRESEQPRLEHVLSEDHEIDRMLILAMDTGLRDGEIRALTWGCIDLTAARLWVKHSLSSSRELGPTKTRKERSVPLTSRLVRLLSSQRARTQLAGDFVFLARDGKPHKINVLRYHLHTRLKLAGLRRMRVHDLRHTFASRLVQRGVSLQVVSKLLGHSNIQQTMRYAHLAPAQFEAAIGMLEQDILHSRCTDEMPTSQTGS